MDGTGVTVDTTISDHLDELQSMGLLGIAYDVQANSSAAVRTPCIGT
jgi:hypothetical protein